MHVQKQNNYTWDYLFLSPLYIMKTQLEHAW